MKCTNCAAEIPIDFNDPLRHKLVTCPTCQAQFYATTNQQGTSLVPAASQKLPRKMSLTRSQDQLHISRHYRSLVRLGLLLIPGFLITFGLFFSELHTLEFLINPLTWMVIGLAVYGLTGMVNRSQIWVTAAQLQLKKGPLSLRRSKKIDLGNVTQFYVEEHVQKSKKSSTVTYRLYLLQKGGDRVELLSDFETAEQALFVEQVLEQFLGLRDRTVTGEVRANEHLDFSSWRTFAALHGLEYVAGKLITGYRIYGRYQDYSIEWIVVEPRLARAPATRLTLTDHHDKSEDALPDLETITSLFADAANLAAKLKGSVTVSDAGKTFIYEEQGTVIGVAYMKGACDLVVGLADIYDQIVPLGGAVMPTLSPIALAPKHPLQPVALQLIREIAPTTERVNPAQAPLLLCPDCLVRCTRHQLDVAWSTDVVYYGCRRCHRSQQLITIQQVVAVLDQEAGSEPSQQGQTLSVNALTRPDLFDFDTLHIINATDELVERFAVQVGNDTDPNRKNSYKNLRCVVSPDCNLSENTMRILGRMFGGVAVKEFNQVEGLEREDALLDVYSEDQPQSQSDQASG